MATRDKKQLVSAYSERSARKYHNNVAVFSDDYYPSQIQHILTITMQSPKDFKLFRMPYLSEVVYMINGCHDVRST